MKNQPTITINSDFKYTLNLLEKTKQSAFLTGRAGTGKSTLLRLFRTTTKKKVVVLAPTGLAALNVNGQTIHSFFGFPPKPISRKDIKLRRNKSLYKKIDIIVIDEVSMVRADMMDNIDFFLRLHRGNMIEPFGGVQMLFVGDLFQLPPVVASNEEAVLMQKNYESPYFFSANVFQELDYERIELQEVFRQEHRHFIRILDDIRTNQFDRDTLEDLNQRVIPSSMIEDDFHITLSPRNALVNKINKEKLAKLTSMEFSFLASVTGNFRESAFPTDAILKLRKDAQVMFVKNDPKRKFVNGTIGKVVQISNEIIKVETNENGKRRIIDVEKVEWEIQRYTLNNSGEIKANIVGTFKQYPLTLAWAITIHKSQGKTFSNIIVDMGRGAFAAGQTYVALSRCKTLDGIVLSRPIEPRDIFTDDRIVEFYEGLF
ncbi:MAG: ATP-dependent RecD-like DNA helicase [Saprospiraceae bacterium]